MRNLGWQCQHTILQIKSNGLLTVKHSVGARCEHYWLLNETRRKKTPGCVRKILRLTKTFFKHLLIFYGYEHLFAYMYVFWASHRLWRPEESARSSGSDVIGWLWVTRWVRVNEPASSTRAARAHNCWVNASAQILWVLARPDTHI